VKVENGVVVRTEPGNRLDDRLDDRRGDGRVVDDNSNSGPGSGGDHAVDDNSNRGPGARGHGADDPPGDDHGGHSGSDG
jgi:hypothetical protein